MRDTLWIGWRLLVGRRGGWRQAALMAVGIGVAAIVLFGIASIPTAIEDRQERDARRDWLGSGERIDVSTPDGLIALGNDRIGNRPISHIVIDPGTRPDVPALGELPPIGRVLVSPALQSALENDPRLAERLMGDIAGEVPAEALVDPDELVSVAVVDSSTVLATGVARTLPRGEIPPNQAAVPPEVLFVVTVALLVVALPVMVFLAGAIELGFERREDRMRLLVLTGAGRWQIFTFGVMETVAAAVVGLAAGAIAFPLLRRLLATIHIGGRPSFPDALAPRPSLAWSVVAIVLAGALVSSFAGTRRLGRETIVRRPGRKRAVAGAVALAFGALGLGVGLWSEPVTDAPHPLALVGMVLTGVGSALSARGLIAMIGQWIGTRTNGGLALLAARRIHRSPGEIVRPTAAVVAVVFAVAAFFTITGTLIRSSNPRYSDLRRDLVLVEGIPGPSVSRIIDVAEAQPGVLGAVAERIVSVADAAGDPLGSGVIADCSALVQTIGLDISDCTAGVRVAQHAGLPPDTMLRLTSDTGADQQLRFTGSTFEGVFQAMAIISPRAVDAAFLDSIEDIVVVARIEPAVIDLESMRTAVVAAYPLARVRTVPEVEFDLAASAREVRTLSTIVLGVVLVVAALSLTVGMAAHLIHRRGALTFLRASGLQPSQLRRLLALESIAPVGVVSAIGTLAGVGAGTAIAISAGTDPEVPWPMITVIYLAAVLLGTIVWAAFAPHMERMTEPNELRFE